VPEIVLKLALEPEFPVAIFDNGKLITADDALLDVTYFNYYFI